MNKQGLTGVQEGEEGGPSGFFCCMGWKMAPADPVEGKQVCRLLEGDAQEIPLPSWVQGALI